MNFKKEKADELKKNQEIPQDISGLINQEEIIEAVEQMLGHELKDKTIVKDILKSHTSVEDYLHILNKSLKKENEKG